MPTHCGFESGLSDAFHASVESKHSGHLPLASNLDEPSPKPPVRKSKFEVNRIVVTTLPHSLEIIHYE